jgi:hypothetical protein
VGRAADAQREQHLLLRAGAEVVQREVTHFVRSRLRWIF